MAVLGVMKVSNVIKNCIRPDRDQTSNDECNECNSSYSNNNIFEWNCEGTVKQNSSKNKLNTSDFTYTTFKANHNQTLR